MFKNSSTSAARNLARLASLIALQPKRIERNQCLLVPQLRSCTNLSWQQSACFPSVAFQRRTKMELLGNPCVPDEHNIFWELGRCAFQGTGHDQYALQSTHAKVCSNVFKESTTILGMPYCGVLNEWNRTPYRHTQSPILFFIRMHVGRGTHRNGLAGSAARLQACIASPSCLRVSDCTQSNEGL